MGDYWKRFLKKYLDKELFIFLIIVILLFYKTFSNNKKEEKQEIQITNKM